MQPDFQQVLRGARRWWWIVILCPMIFGAIAYGITQTRTPLYSARVTMQVQSTNVEGVSDYNQLLVDEQISKTYVRLATFRAVLEAVIADTGLPYTADELSGMITAEFEAASRLLVVNVSDTVPERAAEIANAIAPAMNTVLAADDANSPANTQFTPLVNDLNEQISELQVQIASLEAESSGDGTPVHAVMNFMQDSLDDLTALRDNIVTIQSSNQSPSLKVWDGAVVPSTPYSPRPVFNVAFGIFAGFVIAAGIIMLLVYLDSTVKSSADFTTLLGSPLLSAVTKVPRLAEGRQQLFVVDQPSSEAAESIRLLRTNVEFASAVQEIATLAVSSPASGDGKSTVAANLAVTLSQAGFVTALVDADLRRPELHKIFQVRNDRGLSTVLSRPDVQWHQTVIETGLPNLVLVPSGPVPPNAADLLSLKRLGEVLTDMKRLFDIVIIDTPPILPVSDALAVASHVDGMVLVCRSGRTRIDALRRATTTLQRGAVRIVGVVVNQEKTKGKGTYYASEVDTNPSLSDLESERSHAWQGIFRKARGGQQVTAKAVTTTS